MIAYRDEHRDEVKVGEDEVYILGEDEEAYIPKTSKVSRNQRGRERGEDDTHIEAFVHMERLNISGISGRLGGNHYSENICIGWRLWWHL